MSLRAFNQYITMFFKSHPEPSLAHVKDIITRHEQESQQTPHITSDLIFKPHPHVANEHILVSKHPYAANGHMLQHNHNYFELIYISRGSCTQTINNVRCDMKEGDICILSPSDRHTISIDSPDDLLFNIMIKPELFQESFLCLIAENDFITQFFLTSLFAMSNQQSFLYFPRHENSASGHLIQSLIREFYEKNMGYRKATECYLALLLTELVRCYKERIDRENYELMGNNQLSAILSYMHLHKKTATLQTVAEAFHYHPNYLSSLIKKYTNKSFSDILQQAKLQEACYYLSNTDLSIDEIIHLLGYYDRSYFNRVFKKHYHTTPSEYRQHDKQHTIQLNYLQQKAHLPIS